MLLGRANAERIANGNGALIPFPKVRWSDGTGNASDPNDFRRSREAFHVKQFATVFHVKRFVAPSY